MLKNSFAPVLPILLIAAAACGGNEDPTNPDSMTPVDMPRDVDPTPGGGTSGGPLAQVITVFVEDPRGVPLPDAAIIVEVPGARFTGTTDSEGRADFSDRALLGPANVHVFHGAHRYTSIIGVDASVVTAHLERADDPAIPAIELATASGRVSGWDLLPANTPDRARVAEVIALGDVASVQQAPRPGTVTPGNPDGTEWNLLVNGDSPFPAWTDYRLAVDARTQTLAVLAGTFTVGDAPVLEYTHLGLRTGMKIEVNQELNYQDVAISHALDQRLEVIASDVPRLAERKVHFGLELEGAGEVITLSTAELHDGAATLAYGPALTDALAGARYSATVEARDEAREVTARISGTSATFTFPAMLAPVGGPTAAGRTFAAQPSEGASVHVYTLRDDARNRTLWTAIVAGDATRSIQLPASPEGFDDPLAGRLSLIVSAYDLEGSDPNAMSFADLDRSARSIAKSRASIDL